MYLLSLLSILLVIFILILNKKKPPQENFESEKRIACFPKKKNTRIPLLSTKYPDKYGINKYVPMSFSASNEGDNHEHKINYNVNDQPEEPIPLDYMIIDKDFHTPIEGKEIIPLPPRYNLVRVENTDYFLVDTPNSIWRQVVKKS